MGYEMRPLWWKSRQALTGAREEAAMKPLRDDRGVSLPETMIAVLIALIGVFGLGSLVFQATATNKNQGTETTRATIYAQRDRIMTKEDLTEDVVGMPVGVEHRVDLPDAVVEHLLSEILRGIHQDG